MEGFLQLQIPFIEAFQHAHWLALPMQLLTFLGSAEFFFLVLPVLYWCVDAALGIRVAFILLISTGLSGIAKNAFHGPRPYWLSTRVKAMASDPAFGLPSAHAQNAVGIWGIMAMDRPGRWTWPAAVFLILGIGVSRIYAGVHFVSDVVVGWLFGMVILWAVTALWPRIAGWLRGLTFGRQILVSFAVPAIMIVIGALIVYGLRNYEVPQPWIVNAAEAGVPLVPPVSMDYMVTSGGVLLGFSLGLAVINRAGGFAPAGPLGKRILALVVGIVGVLIFYIGLRVILPSGDSLLAMSLGFLRYSITGFWIAAGAPYVFRQLKLLE
jgi:membrane-associated phospholipid phosphatase